MPLILELEQAYESGKRDPAFDAELHGLVQALCRPADAALLRRAADRASRRGKIYFKRDELNHTGAHKINNVLGQMLLARRMGKKRIIAETGAGSTGWPRRPCAPFGLECVVYMGAADIERQKPNVFRMSCWAPRCGR